MKKLLQNQVLETIDLDPLTIPAAIALLNELQAKYQDCENLHIEFQYGRYDGDAGNYALFGDRFETDFEALKREHNEAELKVRRRQQYEELLKEFGVANQP